MHRFLINTKDANGLRIIDYAQKYLFAVNEEDEGDEDSEYTRDMTLQVIQKLRNAGSAEPIESIGDNNKIDLSNERLDGYIPNQQSAISLVRKLYRKHPLTEEEIEETIERFVTNQRELLESLMNEDWNDEGNSITTLKVIELLSDMREVDDRLSISWDFKKILASAIKATEGSSDATNQLFNALSTLNMCELSKLMFLLHAVQDTLVEATMQFSAAQSNEFYDLALQRVKTNEYFQSNPEKLDVSIKDWITVRRFDDKFPEKWSYEATKVQGIINCAFSDFHSGHISRIDSSEYRYLNNLMKNQLINECILNEESANVSAWKQLLSSAIQKSFNKLVLQIIDDPTQMEALFDQNSYSSKEFFYGDISKININVHAIYATISESINKEAADNFLEKLKEHYGISEKNISDIRGIKNPFEGLKIEEMGMGLVDPTSMQVLINLSGEMVEEGEFSG